MDVPDALARLPQWIIWRYIGSDQRKVPFTITGAPAKTNDPSTWAILDLAIAAGGQLGFVFTESDGFFGLDLDGCRDPQTGNVADWASGIIDCFDTYAEVSPSGTGVKLYGKGTLDKALKVNVTEASVSEKAPGIEVYSKGRYFAFTGQRLEGKPLAVNDCQVNLDALVHRYAPKQRPATSYAFEPSGDVEQRAAAYMDHVAPAISGQGGHNQAYHAAGVLLCGFALPKARAMPILHLWNQRCEPPWKPEELERKCDEVLKNETVDGSLLNETSSDVNLSRFSMGNAEPSEPAELPADAKFADDWYTYPGIISEIVDLNLKTALYPQPELAFAAALGLMATITGRKLTDEFGTRTNCYVLGIAPSGAGKEHARVVNKRILAHAGGENLLGCERVASSAGLVSWLQEKPASLWQLDEIGRLMATMKNPGKSAHLYNVATVLMQLYGSSGTLWIGDAYAKTSQTPQIDQPHCVIYGTSVPEAFWGNLTAENVTDGLLGRFMPFESSAGYVDPQPPQSLDTMPFQLVERVKQWVAFQPASGNLGRAEPLVATRSPDAAERLQEHQQAIHDRRKKEEPHQAALWSRAAGKAAKLALIFAASRQSPDNDVEISFDDADRAVALANWLTRRVIFQVFEHVAENDHEANVKRVWRLLARPLTSRQLLRKARWLKKRERDEIIRQLVEEGMIEQVQDGRVIIYRRV